MSYVNEIMDEAKMTATKEAKRVVVQSIQRVATETAIENSVTVFHIDSDEIKGRIIGREGRNIRARITSYNVCYTKLLRAACKAADQSCQPGACSPI